MKKVKFNFGKKSWICLLAILLLTGLLIAGCAKDDAPDAQESDTQDTTAETPAEESIILGENGEFKYSIVYSRQNLNGEQTAAESLADAMSVVAGARPKLTSDNVAYDAEAFEIYVGANKYEASNASLESTAYGVYCFTRSGNKIIIMATEREVLKRAVNDFISMMKKASDDGVVRIPADFETTKTVYKILSDIPKFESTPTAYCIAESMAYTYVIENSEQGDYDAYITALKDKGYELHSNQTWAGNSFATYHNDGGVVNVSFYPEKKSMHVAVDSKLYTALPETSAGNYTASTTTTLNLLGCSQITKANGDVEDNGFSMFIRLSDGRFVVWDGGGQKADEDAENLYNKLKASAGNGDVVIAGWILTHCHGDHSNAYVSFLKKYASSVEIQKLIINPTTYEYGAANSDGADLESKVINETYSRSSDTDIVIAHAGQRFCFADVTVDIIFTIESIMPMSTEFVDYNLASIVSRVRIGGKTLIVTGDSATQAWDFMSDVYGNYLDCDYLQVPHHGAIPGGTKEAYDLMTPEYLLWSAGVNVFGRVTSSGYNGNDINWYVLNMVGYTQSSSPTAQNDKLYLAGQLGDITTVTFS